jgi:hypothetical protein
VPVEFDSAYERWGKAVQALVTARSVCADFAEAFWEVRGLGGGEPRVAAALIVDAPPRAEVGLRGEPLIVRGGPRSRLARQLGHPSLWGKRLDSKTYLEVIAALLGAAAQYDLVRQVPTNFDVDGWRLSASAVRLVAGEGWADAKPANAYFVDLYTTLADAIENGGGALFGIEGRERTAQVEQDQQQTIV